MNENDKTKREIELDEMWLSALYIANCHANAELRTLQAKNMLSNGDVLKSTIYQSEAQALLDDAAQKISELYDDREDKKQK